MLHRRIQTGPEGATLYPRAKAQAIVDALNDGADPEDPDPLEFRIAEVGNDRGLVRIDCFEAGSGIYVDSWRG